MNPTDPLRTRQGDSCDERHFHRNQLEQIVQAITDCHLGRNGVRRSTCKPLPSHKAIIDIVEQFRSVIFPRCFGPEDVDAASLPFHLGAILDNIHHTLKEQIHRGLCFQCDGSKESCNQCDELASDITTRFMARIPDVVALLQLDVEATYSGDPASKSRDEVIFCYPGLAATMAQRLAHELYKLNVPIIARIITEYAHANTGIDIHPGAQIGESFMIDHGTGVVIGETCIIGDHVRLYQGVTLGAKSFPLDEQGNPIKGIKRHPQIGNDAIIYSGATILGPVVIGDGAVIGGNVWLTDDVPAGSRVLQTRASHDLYGHGDGI